jgi:hypothetical protein
VASLTDPLRQFDAIWHVDFEYREDANHLPVPVSLFAIEQRTGTELFLEREHLLALNRAPFGVGPRDLMVSYASNAELSCFLALGWPRPHNVLDVYVEVVIAINGRTDVWPNKGRPGLLAALSLFDLPTTMTAAEKDRMRDLILNHETYSNEQRRQIRAYNRSDVDATLALLPELLSTIDLPRALHYGRFMAAVAGEERIGLPIEGATTIICKKAGSVCGCTTSHRTTSSGSTTRGSSSCSGWRTSSWRWGGTGRAPPPGSMRSRTEPSADRPSATRSSSDWCGCARTSQS